MPSSRGRRQRERQWAAACPLSGRAAHKKSSGPATFVLLCDEGDCTRPGPARIFSATNRLPQRPEELRGSLAVNPREPINGISDHHSTRPIGRVQGALASIRVAAPPYELHLACYALSLPNSLVPRPRRSYIHPVALVSTSSPNFQTLRDVSTGNCKLSHSPRRISSHKASRRVPGIRPGQPLDTIRLPWPLPPHRSLISSPDTVLLFSHFPSLTIARMSAASEDRIISSCFAPSILYPPQSKLPRDPRSDTESEGDPSLLPSDLGPGAQRYSPPSHLGQKASPTALRTRRR